MGWDTGLSAVLASASYTARINAGSASASTSLLPTCAATMRAVSARTVVLLEELSMSCPFDKLDFAYIRWTID